MPQETIRQRYFRWLYNQVYDVWDVDSYESYIYLCDVMHGIPFGPGVPNDDNRTADGEELRDEFISTQPDIGVEEFAEMQSLGGASIFEVLMALSRRAHPIAEALTPAGWFKRFVYNLNLHIYSDRRWKPTEAFKIQRILKRWNNRKYDPDGRGGIFPLRRPALDQRTIELWFQMSAYMTENEMY